MKTNQTQNTATILCGLLAAVVLMLTGCKSPAYEAMPYEGVSSPDTQVVLAPGDQLDIRFFYTPQLNDQQYIRADGKITLQLVGDVQAAGMKPDELQKDLEKRYTGLIEDPSVAVITRDLSSRSVYVGGAVHRPGLLKIPSHTTALAAIMQSGGFNTKEANEENVLVIRQEEGERKSYVVNLKEVIVGKAQHVPFYLHPQDIVYVPQTKIVKVNQWIDQYINLVVPQTGFTYIYNTGSGDSTIGMDTSY